MRCGSTYRVEVDHIIARARGEFGREYQWMPRNLQILCHEHSQEKMIKFEDWRLLWIRILMPVRDPPAAHRVQIRTAFSPHEYRRAYATAPLDAAQVGWLYPLSARIQLIRSDPPTACVTTRERALALTEGLCAG